MRESIRICRGETWWSVLVLESVLESRSSRFLQNCDVSNQSLIGNKLSCHALG